MTDLVRTVRSGIVGLDLALGGGFRFVRRAYAGDHESAILLIRGGPGVGKSVLAEDLALRLAAAVEGDALYFCVEVLPSEILAQRMGFDDFDPARVADLSRKGHKDPNLTKPSLILGMLDAAVDEAGVPDVGESLLDLYRIAAARGYAPKVVVVDSLSEGYGLGASVSRTVVDGLCKLAVEQGWVLILVEEAPTDAPTPWTFAVDTVLSLRLAAAEGGAQSRRELLVTKHRFGGCEPGPHGLLIERERVRVIPPFSAYRNAVRDLDLPPPAKGRSLAVPTKGETTFPAWFDVADGEGRLVIVEWDGSYGKGAQLPKLSAKIGRRSDAGSPSQGAMCAFFLGESHGAQQADDVSVVVGTLHQFVRGDEWVEAALHQLSVRGRWEGGVASVHIGPTERLAPYEHKDDLARALTLLSGMLSARGLVVILFGESPGEAVRAGIITDRWVLGFDPKAPDPPLAPPAVRASFAEQIFTFVPDLD